MRIAKLNIHKATTSCNFCNRGELNRNGGISYPYDEVYSFQRDEGSGLLAFACEDCLKELFTALLPHITIPASIEQEAEELYPYPKAGHYLSIDESFEKYQADLKRSAHITCARQYTDTIEKLRAGLEILKELCQLKNYKDTVGKDSYYEKRQPELWKMANEFLNELIKEG